MIRYDKSLIQKIFLLIFTIIFASGANASWLSNIASSFTDCLAHPCSCGNSEVNESWGPDSSLIGDLVPGSTSYNESNYTKWAGYTHNIPKTDTNKNCPPYNRYKGRSGCLLQFDAPSSAFLPSWRVYCAEADPDSTFTTPTITIRMQACNIFSCFTKSTSLDASESGCVTWPTQYGIPTIRFCSRVSVNRISQAKAPDGTYLYNADGSPKISHSADDGYMYHFLDTNGFPRPDPGIQNSDGYKVYLPKVCVYEDPSFVEALTGGYMESYRQSGIDTYDRNIYSQFLQYDPTGENSGNPNPGGLDFFSSNVTQNKIVERSFFFNHDESSRSKHFTNSFTSGYNANSTWNDLDFSDWEGGQDNYANWVKQFMLGKNNSLGCTYLPIGPFPPPFCPVLKAVPASVTVQEICPQELAFDTNRSPPGYVVNTRTSTSTEPCVKSSVNNNFIYNSIRVSVDSIVPLCSDTATPATSNCVKLYPSNLTAAAIHKATNDMLPLCLGENPNDAIPCVHAPLSVKPNCPAGSNCENNFRVVFGKQTSQNSQLVQMQSYSSDITALCSPNNRVFPCLGIYGVNNGQYLDISFDLGQSANVSPDYYTESLGLSMSDSLSNSFSITPYISYQGEHQDDIRLGSGRRLKPNSMCVYYSVSGKSNIKAGCVKRAAPPLIAGYACDPLPNGVKDCDPSGSTNFAPGMQVQLTYNPDNKASAGNARVSAGTAPVPTDTAYGTVSARDLGSDSYYNIIGYLIDTVATDSNYYLPPFTSANAEPGNKLTIWGNYLNNIKPLKRTGTKDQGNEVYELYQPESDVQYLNGIEYFNGKYIKGGMQLWAAPVNNPTCHMPKSMNSKLNATVSFDDSFCVLATLNHYDKVDCNAFKASKASTRCSPDQVSCTLTATIGNVVKIHSCSGALCYEADSLPLDVCAVSTLPDKRVMPAPNTILNRVNLYPSEYYDTSTIATGECAPPSPNTQATAYNTSKCGIRDKTMLEIGVSADIPTPSACPAITTANSSTGYATWTQANEGQQSTGTCLTGYNPPTKGLATRGCYVNMDNQVAFPQVTKESTCIIVTCPATTEGYATWSAAKYGENSTPTCQTGYKLSKDGFSPRKCEQLGDGTYNLTPLKDGESCIEK